ncbi:MAG: GFA family protein [Porticoccaceae bacterium]|nr:GFA family protein [Porticoccaceae bacterium]
MDQGGCLCGAIRYQYDPTHAEVAIHCHCKDCQRVTGSGKATVVMFPESAVTIDGVYKTYANIGTDKSHVNRGFCPNCGSQMFTFVQEIPDKLFIKAGTFDASDWVKVTLNCWASSAAHWLEPDRLIESVAQNPTA